MHWERRNQHIESARTLHLPPAFSGPEGKALCLSIQASQRLLFEEKNCSLEHKTKPIASLKYWLGPSRTSFFSGHGLSRRESSNHIGAQVGVLSSLKNKAQNQYRTQSTSTRYEFRWSSRRMDKGVWKTRQVNDPTSGAELSGLGLPPFLCVEDPILRKHANSKPSAPFGLFSIRSQYSLSLRGTLPTGRSRPNPCMEYMLLKWKDMGEERY